MMTFPIYGKNKKCSKPPTSFVYCNQFGIVWADRRRKNPSNLQQVIIFQLDHLETTCWGLTPAHLVGILFAELNWPKCQNHPNWANVLDQSNCQSVNLLLLSGHVDRVYLRCGAKLRPASSEMSPEEDSLLA